jgi:hypothetical protein
MLHKLPDVAATLLPVDGVCISSQGKIRFLLASNLQKKSPNYFIISPHHAMRYYFVLITAL